MKKLTAMKNPSRRAREPGAVNQSQTMIPSVQQKIIWNILYTSQRDIPDVADTDEDLTHDIMQSSSLQEATGKTSCSSHKHNLSLEDEADFLPDYDLDDSESDSWHSDCVSDDFDCHEE